MTTGSYYSIRPRRIGRYASTLEASWALHLRPMCDRIEYVGATLSSYDFLVVSAGREVAVEIKPQLNDDNSAQQDRNGIPTIVYEAAARAYQKQVEQTSIHGLVVTLIATGYPETAKWFLVLCEADDPRYRHRHMRNSKRVFDDINIRSLSDYTIYVLDGGPEIGDQLAAWITTAVNQCTKSVDITDYRQLSERAQRPLSEKQKRKLVNRARQAERCRNSQTRN